MSFNNQPCAIYLLDKNFEWNHQTFENDLAQDAALHQARSNKDLVYASEDFGQANYWFDAIERIAKTGKKFEQIDQTFEEEEG